MNGFPQRFLLMNAVGFKQKIKILGMTLLLYFAE